VAEKMSKFGSLLVVHSEAAVLQATVERTKEWMGLKWRGASKHLFEEVVVIEK
jgi:hypothetical protein